MEETMGDTSDRVNIERGRGEIRQTHVKRTHFLSIGKELIFDEAEREVPVVFGRNPATEDPKYTGKAPDEIHVRLYDEGGQEIRSLSRRSLSMTFMPTGYRIANLTGRALSYEINPNSRKTFSPKAVVNVPVRNMRNFEVEIADGLVLGTQSIGGGTGKPNRVLTLLFKRGSI